MRCRSIGYSGLVHSVHQSDQSFSGNRSGCLCKHATAHLRAKLKSPKLSSWEDCSPSRSTANNQKCSESSSRSLSPCPPFVLEPMHYQCLCKSSIPFGFSPCECVKRCPSLPPSSCSELKWVKLPDLRALCRQNLIFLIDGDHIHFAWKWLYFLLRKFSLVCKWFSDHPPGKSGKE